MFARVVTRRRSLRCRTSATMQRPNMSFNIIPSMATMPTFRMYAAEAVKPTDEEIKSRLFNVIKQFPGVKIEGLNDNSNFTTDLGIDSLDRVELVMAIEDEFCIEVTDEEAEKVLSVPDALEMLTTNPHVK
eukprot:TRINITY_DN3218_c1_g3_i1.p1 TRINITY_DN3218_c1_g3~~TRINITY_DN3218_c1_g3_i1.p1  ORF type:complete len:131 (+),score=38.50 TRINITY_DN3218_c1_g3_i1:34-426(+)